MTTSRDPEIKERPAIARGLWNILIMESASGNQNKIQTGWQYKYQVRKAMN